MEDRISAQVSLYHFLRAVGAWISAGDWHLWICNVVEPSLSFFVRHCVVCYSRGGCHAHCVDAGDDRQETQRKTSTTSLLQQHRPRQCKWNRGMRHKLEHNMSGCLVTAQQTIVWQWIKCSWRIQVSFPGFRGQCTVQRGGFQKSISPHFSLFWMLYKPQPLSIVSDTGVLH